MISKSDLPFSIIPETQQYIGERGFPAATGADDGVVMASFKFEIETLEDRSGLLIISCGWM